MKSRFLLFHLVLLQCVALFFGCLPTFSVPSNLVEYAVEAKNDLLQPRDLEFGMTAEEVCGIKGMQISDLQEDSENNTSLRRTVTIEGLSDKVYEIFSFYDGKLVSVSYSASVDEEAFETLMAKVTAEAEDILPEAMRKGDSRWTDSQGNWVSIGSGSTDEDSNKEVITLHIAIPRTSLYDS